MRPDALLVPRPLRVERLDGSWTVPRRLELTWPGDDPDGLAATAAAWLDEATTAASPQPAQRLRLAFEDSLDSQAYRLEVAAGGVALRAGDARGLLYGVATLCQWLVIHGRERTSEAWTVPAVRIVDAPDLARRGVLLDVSRNRVPRLAELEATIDRLARLKIEMVQLYVEHTFAYDGHEEVWRGWSPLTADDVRRLDRFCRARGVELVPNQNSFGHLHRWLVHPRYRPLAECPDGIEHPFSLEVEPFSLCPLDPGSLALLDDLYGQLLPCHSSGWFNVGLDETLDLGRCRSREAVEAHGRARVYLDFLRAVDARVRDHGRRTMFWGDIVLEHPELVAELPPEALVLAWGYEPDHPFEHDAPRFAAAEHPFILCPGTGSWNAFAPRIADALENLHAATRAARTHGAEGVLICDWGDHGHLQPMPTSWPGLLAGAALAWRVDRAVDPPRLAAWLDRHVFDDPTDRVGEALLTLGEAHRATGLRVKNGSPLFFALLFAHRDLAGRRVVPPELPDVEQTSPTSRPGIGRLSIDGLDAAEATIDRALETLSASRSRRPDAALVRDELRWTADAMRCGAAFERERIAAGATPTADVALESLPADARRRLATRLDELAEHLRPLWLARSRPGGLEASIDRLTVARHQLR